MATQVDRIVGTTPQLRDWPGVCAGTELTAKLEGLRPGTSHAFRVRSKQPQRPWGDWGAIVNVVYSTLSRQDDTSPISVQAPNP